MHCEKVKIKSGYVWECVADGPPNPATGKRRQIRRRGKTQREAKQRVEDAIRKLSLDGIDESISRTVTFEELANKWLEVYAATGVKRGSIRVRRKEINILKKYFGKSPITAITHAMYQEALIHMSKKGNDGKPYADNTIDGVNTCASMIFKYAIKNKLIKHNPREGAIVPKKPITIEELEKNSIEEKFMESDELDEFLGVVLSKGLNMDKEWFFTLAFSGMRPGELLALKKEDMDFNNNRIRITKTLINENNNMREYYLDTTKTNKARIIDMDERIMFMLRKLIHNNDKHKMKSRTLIDDFHDEDFVFMRPNGYPFYVKNLGDRMRRLMRFANIEKHLTPHCFRHTHISMLAEAGVDLPTIMQRVGHEDPDTTLKIYTHVTNKMKERSVESVTSHHKKILEKLPI